MIGVLDLQGGVAEHIDHLERIGIPVKSVKESEDLKDLTGLIIPGGESTCLSRLIHIFGLKDAIIQRFNQGMKIWGTCAGAILLAKTIVGEGSCLGLIDLDIERNSFGSQLDSFTSEAVIPDVSTAPIPLIFIRAPKILRTGPEVKVLLKTDEYIAAAESPGVMVTIFHPELTGGIDFHRYFARKCGLAPLDDSQMPSIDPGWNTKSWTSRSLISSLDK
jgi:5'-phosphate synthase pdxT subunit